MCEDAGKPLLRWPITRTILGQQIYYLVPSPVDQVRQGGCLNRSGQNTDRRPRQLYLGGPGRWAAWAACNWTPTDVDTSILSSGLDSEEVRSDKAVRRGFVLPPRQSVRKGDTGISADLRDRSGVPLDSRSVGAIRGAFRHERCASRRARPLRLCGQTWDVWDVVGLVCRGGGLRPRKSVAIGKGRLATPNRDGCNAWQYATEAKNTHRQ